MPCIFRLSFLSSFLLRLPSVRTCTSSPRALASESGGGASDAHARRDGSPLFAADECTLRRGDRMRLALKSRVIAISSDS